MAGKEAVGEQESREILKDKIDAWWMSVIVGQTNGSHPIRGNEVNGRVENGVLVINGQVPSEQDRRDIEAEVEHLRGEGFTRIRNELKVVPDKSEEKGLLSQTLMAIFETEEQAGFAEGYLEKHTGVRPLLMEVITPTTNDRETALRAVLSEGYLADAMRALDAGRVLLLVTVDETEAFKAREIVDEETQSLETIVQPPQTVGATTAAQHSVDEDQAPGTSSKLAGRAEDARQQAIQSEATVHAD